MYEITDACFFFCFSCAVFRRPSFCENESFWMQTHIQNLVNIFVSVVCFYFYRRLPVFLGSSLSFLFGYNFFFLLLMYARRVSSLQSFSNVTSSKAIICCWNNLSASIYDLNVNKNIVRRKYHSKWFFMLLACFICARNMCGVCLVCYTDIFHPLAHILFPPHIYL